MIGTLVIVFREVLEAALVIGIVLAATRGVTGRGWWVGGGIAAGLFGSTLVAAFARGIAETAAGMGQEVFNASLLFAAVVMLGWHNVWMGRHGRELAHQMKAVGHRVRTGEQPLLALATVVSLAVLREGSEVVLFLYGIAAGGDAAMSMLGGGALGLLAGVAVGLALYLGLLRIPIRHLFTVTSGLIVLLAAGMAAQAAGFLIQADWLPAWRQPLWDASAILSDRSLPGQILHVLAGYNDRPAGMQVAFYFATLLLIGGLMWFIGNVPTPQSKQTAAAV
ncbi:MAG: FTR1 family protein [Candidatus Competibacteraceae bacterium]